MSMNEWKIMFIILAFNVTNRNVIFFKIVVLLCFLHFFKLEIKYMPFFILCLFNKSDNLSGDSNF